MALHVTDVNASTHLAKHRGIYEITLNTKLSFGNPYLESHMDVEFTRPDGSKVSVEGYYDGGSLFKARAYCDQQGRWQWRTASNVNDLNGCTGWFEVIPSPLKGKLRIHPTDPRQFAYDDGSPYLHIGDTGYRYLVDVEPNWQMYIDQAVCAGFTKIRCWFSQGRHDVQGLFQHDRQRLNLAYWQEMDRRLVYALNHYSDLQVQLIIYSEDADEVNRYGTGDKISMLVARYAQARFSSFGNVQWCISNDLKLDETIHIVERTGAMAGNPQSDKSIICQIGRDMATREPWGTLLTNHQMRFTGYYFTDEVWSDIITIEDLGQVGGEKIQQYRKAGRHPVILEEDRYEHWRPPVHDRYFFRRIMWASLLSGGHFTYGGLKTFEPYNGGLSGMYGYYDACLDGRLESGAHDYIFVSKFFADSRLTLAGMVPDDALTGNQSIRFKSMRSNNGDVIIVYAQNPDLYEGHSPDGFHGHYTDEEANVADTVPVVELSLSASDKKYTVSWFKPSNGMWTDDGSIVGLENKAIQLKAPGSGDWIVLLRKET